MMLDKQLYQVIMLTIDAPTPIAIALVGFKVEDTLLSNLKATTQLETTLQVYTGQAEVFRISTLPEALVDRALAQLNQHPSWLSITVTKDTPYVSLQFNLADNLGSQTVITLSEDAEALFADFNSLQFNITAIGLLAVLLATI